MKVLVIPDVHLKPYMFQRAAELLRQGVAERAVCLMDIADDWNKQNNVGLYEETYGAAVEFAKAFPDTLWCYGNHDVSYVWHRMETGYSKMAAFTVQKCLIDLKAALPENNPIKFVQRIDNVLFSHGGVREYFVNEHVPEEKVQDVDAVLDMINGMGPDELWNDISPIWFRPQYNNAALYQQENLLQVVGHTPMKKITKKGNVISCDVFSTYQDGTTMGTEEFTLLDTVTWEYRGIK